MPAFLFCKPERFANVWLFVWIAAAVASFAGWSSLSRSAQTASPQVSRVSLEPCSTSKPKRFRSIEQIKVGDRVATNLPKEVWETDFVSLDEDTVAGPDIDPSSWRLIRMYGETKVGGEVLDDHRIETLQHMDWLKHHRVQVGLPCPVPLDLEEMESDPDLKVVATEILPCPPIKTGKGRIVMTTVNHFNVDVWNLVVEDESGRRETIKPTGKHRFFSVTHATGVATQDLEPGECLLGDAGPVSVVSLHRESGKQRVFNMTVQGEHVYRVSLMGVLTHNNYPNDYSTNNTRNWSSWFNSEGEARTLARQKIGANPVEISPGKLRSQDGKWQYRAKPGDVADNHVHLEELNPATGEVLQNYHLHWPEGAGR